MTDYVTCVKCLWALRKDRAITSTRRLGEAGGVEYRHPECSDAWGSDNDNGDLT